MVEIQRPAVLSDVVRLPHRLREAGLWGVEPDVFTLVAGVFFAFSAS